MAASQTSARRRSAQEWQSLLSKLATSGEDLTRFCRRQGIHPPTLRWWRWRLRGASRRLAPALRPAQTSAAAEPIRVEFTELRVPETASRSVTAEGFELRWPDGLTLAIPAQFDEVALRRLLIVLEVEGC